MTRGDVLTRRKTLSIIIAFAVCVGIVLAPTPAGLTREGQNALAIFALCFVLWVGNALPLAVTSLLAIVLLPTLRVLPASRSFELFGSPVVFFILGAFILAAALMRSGLSTRLALPSCDDSAAVRDRFLRVSSSQGVSWPSGCPSMPWPPSCFPSSSR